MRPEIELEILQLAEAYAQNANTPRRSASFLALEKSVRNWCAKMESENAALLVKLSLVECPHCHMIYDHRDPKS